MLPKPSYEKDEPIPHSETMPQSKNKPKLIEQQQTKNYESDATRVGNFEESQQKVA